jgi:hypothetical protein
MNRLFIIIFFILPIVSFISCEDDVLDDPVSVDLQVNMTKMNSSEKTFSAGRKHLQIDSGKMTVSNIVFDGTRENAEDYYFSKTFQNGLIAYLEKNKLNKKVTFDIPQGTYHPAKIKLQLNPIDSIDALLLHGSYSHPVFEKTEVEFSFFETEEPIELTIQNVNESKKVVFNKGKTKTLEIQLNLPMVFALLNPKRLENASITEEGNKRKIIISHKHNEELYYDLVDRIEKSTKAILK